MKTASVNFPSAQIFIIGSEKFCIPPNLMNPLNNLYSGSLLILRFKATQTGRLGPPAENDYAGVVTNVSLQQLPGGLSQSTSDLLRLSVQDASYVGVEQGFKVYNGTASDVFVDEDDPNFFFDCFPLPKYEQTADRKYTYCKSSQSVTGSVRMSFTFPANQILHSRMLRSDVMSLIREIHVAH